MDVGTLAYKPSDEVFDLEAEGEEEGFMKFGSELHPIVQVSARVREMVRRK